MSNKNIAEPQITTNIIPPTETVATLPRRYNTTCSETFWYYNIDESAASPPGVYQKLIGSARKRIKIWDPHLNKGDKKIFNNVNPAVDIEILSSGLLAESLDSLYVDSLTDKNIKFVQEMKDLKKRKGLNITLKYSDSNKLNSGKNIEENYKALFHDRFLFIDDDVYFVGSSVGYHVFATKSTAMCKITDDLSKEIIYKEFEKVWNDERTHILIV